MAKQLGIDLHTVKGTGANGRVLEEDLKAGAPAAAAPAGASFSAPPPRVLEDQTIQITDNVGKGMAHRRISYRKIDL